MAADIKRILWPTDLSNNALFALPYVRSMSEKFQAEVHLLYVAEDVTWFDHFYGDADPKFLMELQDKIMKSAEEQLEKLCMNDLAGCPTFRRDIIVGNPVEEILRTIREAHMDLVIMATHGHGLKGTMTHFPFGSVTEKVTKSSPVPVLIVNPQTS
ncbi:MAG: universal stress protein [Nitrospirae bacterium]|nr:universal stress protein [Nitrospirota bacterium]